MAAASEMTVSASVQGFLQSKAGNSANYLRTLRTTFNAVTSTLGDIQMRSLREDHLSAIFDRWLVTLGPGTYNRQKDHIHLWLVYASRRRQLRLSPDELLGGVSRRRVVPRKRTYLSAQELLALLDAAHHPRDRMYLALAMNTALRASEIVTLRLEDVDLDGGSLYVLRHKTGTRDVLPITKDLDQELRRWLRFYTQKVGALKPHFLLTPAKHRPGVYRRKLTAAELASADLKPEAQMQLNNEIMRRLLADAGFPVEYEGLHTIRRSVARVSYEYFQAQGETRDEALSVVQATLGHATQSITERYIGVERFREKRDRVMRNQPFLSAMIGNDGSNVRRLPVEGHSAS